MDSNTSQEQTTHLRIKRGRDHAPRSRLLMWTGLATAGALAACAMGSLSQTGAPIVATSEGAAKTGSNADPASVIPVDGAYRPLDYDTSRFGPQAQAIVLFPGCPGMPLIEHNADAQGELTSLTKMMTLLLALETINDDRYTLDTMTPVRVPASAIPDPSLHLAVIEGLTAGTELPLLAFMQFSGARSDATATGTVEIAVANARGWTGTDAEKRERFVEEMNARARAIGMRDTVFGNATGIDGNQGTVRDMAVLMNYLHSRYQGQAEQILGNNAILTRGILNEARNGQVASSRILRQDIYDDPSSPRYDPNLENPDHIHVNIAKTGAFQAQRYFNEGAVVTVKRDGVKSRMVIVIRGARNENERAAMMRDLYNRASRVNIPQFCRAPVDAVRVAFGTGHGRRAPG